MAYWLDQPKTSLPQAGNTSAEHKVSSNCNTHMVCIEEHAFKDQIEHFSDAIDFKLLNNDF